MTDEHQAIELTPELAEDAELLHSKLKSAIGTFVTNCNNNEVPAWQCGTITLDVLSRFVAIVLESGNDGDEDYGRETLPEVYKAIEICYNRLVELRKKDGG